jgi:hypothetical protein
VGIDHAVAAQGWARHSDNPSLRAYAADVAARAYALDREAQACRRELTLAHGELTGSYGPGDEASLVYFHSEGQLASTESLCRLLLGDPHGAAEDAERSLALIDPSFVRNQALSMLYISNANIQLNEVDQATSVLGDAAELAARNRSARLTDRLFETRAALRPWDTTRAVQELDERLRLYGFS